MSADRRPKMNYICDKIQIALLCEPSSCECVCLLEHWSTLLQCCLEHIFSCADVSNAFVYYVIPSGITHQSDKAGLYAFLVHGNRQFLFYTDSGANAFRVIEHHSVVTNSYNYHIKVNPIKQPNQHHLPLLCCLKHYHFTYLQQQQSLPACCQQHQQQQRIATGSMNKWVLKSKEIKTFFAA